jgi:hypothetical protein
VTVLDAPDYWPGGRQCSVEPRKVLSQVKGAAALVPAQRWRDPEREQRAKSQLTGLITTPFCGSYPERQPKAPMRRQARSAINSPAQAVWLLRR